MKKKTLGVVAGLMAVLLAVAGSVKLYDYLNPKEDETCETCDYSNIPLYRLKINEFLYGESFMPYCDLTDSSVSSVSFVFYDDDLNEVLDFNSYIYISSLGFSYIEVDPIKIFLKNGVNELILPEFDFDYLIDFSLAVITNRPFMASDFI